jgi:hypothetical protein
VGGVLALALVLHRAPEQEQERLLYDVIVALFMFGFLACVI